MSGFVWSLSQNGLVVSELQWEIWEPDKNVARCCFLQRKILWSCILWRNDMRSCLLQRNTVWALSSRCTLCTLFTLCILWLICKVGGALVQCEMPLAKISTLLAFRFQAFCWIECKSCSQGIAFSQATEPRALSLPLSPKPPPPCLR